MTTFDWDHMYHYDIDDLLDHVVRRFGIPRCETSAISAVLLESWSCALAWESDTDSEDGPCPSASLAVSNAEDAIRTALLASGGVL